MTFFITLPPDLKASPRPLTPLKPSRWSRAAPAETRRGPARLPMTAPTRVPCPASWPSKRAEVGRLEGQHLVALGQQRLDLAHRRAGAQGDDQFFRRVVDDARQAREVEHLVAGHGLAERQLAALAAHVERHGVIQRPFDRLPQLLGVAHNRMVGVGARRQGQPDQPTRPVVECFRRRPLGLDARDDAGTFSRRTGDLPDNIVAHIRQGHQVAYVTPERPAFERAKLFHPRRACQQDRAGL